MDKYITSGGEAMTGGLCNKIFPVVTSYALSKKLGKKCAIDMNEYKIIDTHPNNTQHLYLSTIFKKMPIVYDIEYDYILYDYISYDNRQYYYYHDNFNELSNISGNIKISGYYQSYKYFTPTDAHEILCFDDYKYLEKKYGIDRLKNSYFIHVRRGDFINNLHDKLSFNNYFKYALNIMHQNYPYSNIAIFSDDNCYAIELQKIIPNSYIINEVDVGSLYLMSKCFLGGICSNSTFSWWGSYLNNNVNKIVIMPDKWITDSNDNTDYNKLFFYDNVIVQKVLS